MNKLNPNLLWLLLLVPSVLVQTYVYPVTLLVLATAYLASKYLKDPQEQPNLQLQDQLSDLQISHDLLKQEIQELNDKIGRVNLAVSQQRNARGH